MSLTCSGWWTRAARSVPPLCLPLWCMCVPSVHHDLERQVTKGTAAKRLYEGLGFVVVDPFRSYPPAMDMVFMSRGMA